MKALWLKLKSISEYRAVRRYFYAVGEVVGVCLTAFSFSVVFLHQTYQFGERDPGMAKITGLCLLFVGIGIYIFAYSFKLMDARVSKIETLINVK